MIEEPSTRMEKSLRPGADPGWRIAGKKNDGARRRAGLTILDNRRNRWTLRAQHKLRDLHGLAQVSSATAKAQEERKRVKPADDGLKLLFKRCGIAFRNVTVENEVAKDGITRPIGADLIVRLNGLC